MLIILVQLFIILCNGLTLVITNVIGRNSVDVLFTFLLLTSLISFNILTHQHTFLIGVQINNDKTFKSFYL